MKKILYFLLFGFISMYAFENNNMPIYAKILYVVDGDTIHFKYQNKKIKCRLAFIDTPESRLSNKANRDIKKCHISKKEMFYLGKKSTQYLKKLIGNAKNLQLFISKKTDRYKRNICIIKNNSVNLNESLVENGYAVPFLDFTKDDKIKKKYIKLLMFAKKSKLGLWAINNKFMRCIK